MAVKGAGAVLEAVGCIVDAHTHLPLSSFPHQYLERLARLGVSRAVVLGLPDFRPVLAKVSLESVRRDYERTLNVIRRHVPRELWDTLTPEALYYTSLKLAESYGPLCSQLLEDRALVQSLIDIAEMGLEVRVFHAVDLSRSPEEVIVEVEEAYRRGARGVKIISTFYMKYLDDPSVEAAVEAAEQLDIPVIVHAGCDPGIWELPSYCRYGDPSRLEPVVRRHRGARIVVAHVGGYSAIAPGVFTAETLELLRRYPNVYADVSALNPVVVEMAAKSAPKGKLLYGSDYPVVDRDPESIIASYYQALLYAGYSRRDLEAFFHATASEILDIKC